MLEVLVEVDRRPLSRWACDGMLVSTPYWLNRVRVFRRRPGDMARVDAALGGPLSAHATVRARPARAEPNLDVVVEVLGRPLPDTRRGVV
jgi:NAD+ kinase